MRAFVLRLSLRRVCCLSPSQTPLQSSRTAIVTCCRPTSVSPAENLILRSSLSLSLSRWPAQHASLRSQRHRTSCARRSKAHKPTHASTTYHPSDKHIAIRRDGLLCPRRHGPPPALLPTRRTTIPQPPPRVFKFEFPTALSHVDRPTADADTIRRSLLAPTRSISARVSCKKRKSRTRSSWVATSTRYVKEHVTQEPDWRWTHRSVGSPVDAQCLRTEFRVCSGSTLRLGYLDQPSVMRRPCTHRVRCRD